MGIVSGGGGGGNTTGQVVASGKVVPVADASGVTVDTTTYNDTVKGSGKLATLVFPADQGALAIAISGDLFPRWVLAADTINGLWFGDGTEDPTFAGEGGIQAKGHGFGGTGVPAAMTGSAAVRLNQVSPVQTIKTTALPTVQLVSGTASQVLLQGRDVEAHTPVTFTPGVATTATCTVALSPDNVTFSTLAVVTKPVGTVFDGEIEDVIVRVPDTWYLKLTVVNATLGVTTLY